MRTYIYIVLCLAAMASLTSLTMAAALSVVYTLVSLECKDAGMTAIVEYAPAGMPTNRMLLVGQKKKMWPLIIKTFDSKMQTLDVKALITVSDQCTVDVKHGVEEQNGQIDKILATYIQKMAKDGDLFPTDVIGEKRQGVIKNFNGVVTYDDLRAMVRDLVANQTKWEEFLKAIKEYKDGLFWLETADPEKNFSGSERLREPAKYVKVWAQVYGDQKGVVCRLIFTRSGEIVYCYGEYGERQP